MTDGPLRALIFESGLGGLSVFREVAARLPGLECVYAADTAFFPYGTKPEEALVRRLPRLMAALAARYRPDIAVIACNTASTVALPPIRVALSVPVVGTVPAIKPAATISRSRTIGLLGTPGTVRRAYTDRLIDQFAADCRVLRHGSAELVALAEAKLRHGRVALSDVRAAVAPLLAEPGAGELDVVVLACTHFPLIADELRACLPPGLALIDSGDAIARRVADLLGPDETPRPTPAHLAVVTSAPLDAHGPRNCFSDGGFARVDLFDEECAAAATVA
ncbi:MAG: glutamate racemase [Kiloniellales bacterium]|nr:glutamate racemase [Kiloniellales bacterium]